MCVCVSNSSVPVLHLSVCVKFKRVYVRVSL